jgi:hypothetical protein
MTNHDTPKLGSAGQFEADAKQEIEDIEGVQDMITELVRKHGHRLKASEFFNPDGVEPVRFRLEVPMNEEAARTVKAIFHLEGEPTCVYFESAEPHLVAEEDKGLTEDKLVSIKFQIGEELNDLVFYFIYDNEEAKWDIRKDFKDEPTVPNDHTDIRQLQLLLAYVEGKLLQF